MVDLPRPDVVVTETNLEGGGTATTVVIGREKGKERTYIGEGPYYTDRIKEIVKKISDDGHFAEMLP